MAVGGAMDMTLGGAGAVAMGGSVIVGGAVIAGLQGPWLWEEHLKHELYCSHLLHWDQCHLDPLICQPLSALGDSPKLAIVTLRRELLPA